MGIRTSQKVEQEDTFPALGGEDINSSPTVGSTPKPTEDGGLGPRRLGPNKQKEV